MKNYFIVFLAICFWCNLQSQTKPLFEKISSRKSKIKFNNKITETKKENIFIYDNLYAGAGIAIGDINNDGLQDLYFSGNQVQDKLYINKGDFIFEDITKSSGIKDQDIGWSSSVSMVDFNNDGRLDIFVTKELYDDKPEWRRDKLYLNLGNNKFKDVAQKVGLGDTLRTRAVAFFDFDKDNDLDVFLLHQPPNPGTYSVYKEMSDSGALLDTKYAPRLYENRDNVFYDISEQANVLSPGFSNAVCIADINNDGFLDIILTNDFEAPDKLYLNDGKGKFKNIANDAFKHTSFYSMGIDIADINNDGFLDVFTVDMVAEDNFRLKSNMSGMDPKKFWRVVDKKWNYQYMYNALQLNNGNTTFSDIASISGVSKTDWSWSSLIADFDNDGHKDIFVSNGLLRDIRNTDANKNVKIRIHEEIQEYLKENGNLDGVTIWDIVDQSALTKIYPSNKIMNKGYRNNGNYIFEDMSSDWGLDDLSFSNGAAYGDLDNDGDLDLVVNNINDKAFIYKNNSKKNYLRIHLRSKKHKPLFGSRVVLESGEGKQIIETTNVRGMYSTSEKVAHFGVGDLKTIKKVIVTWPNKTITVLKNVLVNQELEVFLETGIQEDQKKSEPKKLLTEITNTSAIKYKHRENNFDDYKHQVLLPHKMSEFGPALAVSDINNDGLEDFYVGGAFGSAAVLYQQDKAGNFSKTSTILWEKEKDFEDVDALFFDVNGDGYQDLYVVSGGNTYNENDAHYADRLYINDGTGHFKKDKKFKSKAISGSVVKATDYDNDGDIDIFVGGRHVPHQYPLPVSSLFFKNENGKLVNKTKEIAPELKDLGLVTDASWVDYDGDGDTDLIVVGEWMPITVFKNENGKLSKTELKDFKNTSGWWFSIDKGDFDNDGDIDFVVGNLGLNHKYKTAKDTPFDIYYSDFDNNGSNDLVLGYYNNEKHYPLRGFSCSSQQIPTLKKQIKKYDLFAALEIEDVYGKNNLKAAIHYKADTFKSMYIENLGDGNFKLSPLPIQAQFSNINDLLVEDFNDDGYLDLLTVNNLFSFEIETPRNDAGTGLLMLGDGNGNFSPQSTTKSGFFANKDAKKIKRLKTANETFVIVANNNDSLQIFKKKNSAH